MNVPPLRPMYVVAFDATPGLYLSPHVMPVVPLVPGTALNDATGPHGLDRDLVEALPALWYCLQLPRTFFDMTAWPSVQSLLLSYWLAPGHVIVLCPATDLYFLARQRQFLPALVFCPDRLIDVVTPAAVAAGFTLPPVPFTSLSDETLSEHWEAVAGLFGIEGVHDKPTRLIRRLDLAGVSIAREQLFRTIGRAGGEVTDPDDVVEALADLLRVRRDLNVVAQHGMDVDPADIAAEQMREHGLRARFPLTLTVPGVSPRYLRRAYEPEQVAAFGAFSAYTDTDVWSPAPPTTDEAAERSALGLTGAVAATATDSVALTMPAIPAKAWQELHNLEQHLATPRIGGKPSKVSVLLDRLDKACAPIWTDAVTKALRAASTVQVVSNFPVGLLTPPGHRVPLASGFTVVQRPATPLTRVFQQSFLPTPIHDYTGGVDVLVCECIPLTDPVGATSRAAMVQTKALLDETGSSVRVKVTETDSPEEIRTAIARHLPKILVLSAHGYYPTDGTASGLEIGGRLAVMPDLGELPPVVLLSACSTSVRGDGGPTFTDQLIARGAVTVLGAQVPVHVFRNSLLMGRLLTNLASVYRGEIEARSFLDLWHYVQLTNFVNDVVHANDNLRIWATTATNGEMAPLTDFMIGVGCEVPLGRQSIQEDTYARLLHVAERRGVREKIARWLPKRFVPETAFYQLVGEPDRIMLTKPRVELLAPGYTP